MDLEVLQDKLQHLETEFNEVASAATDRKEVKDCSPHEVHFL